MAFAVTDVEPVMAPVSDTSTGLSLSSSPVVFEYRATALIVDDVGPCTLPDSGTGTKSKTLCPLYFKNIDFFETSLNVLKQKNKMNNNFSKFLSLKK